MRLHSISYRLAATLLFALVLGAFIFPFGVQTQSDLETDPIVWLLPSAWQGAEQIDSAGVAQTMPPFEVLVADGDFVFSRVGADDEDTDGHVRILPVPDPESEEPRRLILGWRVGDDELAAMAGNVVEVSVAARTYSPPNGVQLFMMEGVGPGSSRSSTVINDVEWQTYSMARLVAGDALTTTIGLDWELPAGNAWLEFRDMQVSVRAADSFTNTLAPTVVVPTPTPTRTPEVVTSTPIAPDVFAAATIVAEATAQADLVGTATPTPDNRVTATFTPTPFIILATATPGNQATAAAVALFAEAVALTTGTPTALPIDAMVATATPTATPKPRATRTPTPFIVYFDDMTPTGTPSPTPVFPDELMGKILFKATFIGTERRPDYIAMNPDGSGLPRLTGAYWYNRAVERDKYSGNRQYYVFNETEQDGFRRLQLFYDFIEYGTTYQLTFFGAGKAWDPVWSPTDDVVAFVSNENRNDEIWIVRRDEWPAIQLTDNDWAWDKHPSWSPDGSQIIYSSNRGDGRLQIWIMDADGGNQRPLTNFPFEAWDPVWAKYPDS